MPKEPPQRIISLTHCLSRPVVDSRGREVGNVKDLVVLFWGLHPRVSKLNIARAGEEDLLVAWESVAEMAETPRGSTVILDRPREELTPADLRGNEMALRRNILDK
ncbi:MAG: PRC-barrel domain-containing protein, partial [Candidatus Methylomirabilales bacterium]